METMTDPIEAVNNGIAWADENIPDWRQHVKSEGFDVNYGDQCFLGQYWNSHNPDLGYHPQDAYYYARRAFSESDIFEEQVDWSARNGFTSDSYVRTTYNSNELNSVWLDKLRELGL